MNMSGILRILSRRAVPLVRGQTANLHAAAPKEKIGAVECTIGIGILAGAIMGPASWILAHLEDYKKKA